MRVRSPGRPSGVPPSPGGVGAAGPSRADLAALGRLSVAGWPSLASPPASRGSGARGERHRAARLSLGPRVSGSSLFLCRVPAKSLSVKGSQCRLALSRPAGADSDGI